MLVSIVILTYLRTESVLTLLSQLSALDDPWLEIIVVDNGSGPEAAATIANAYPRVRLVVLPENKGVGSRNRGLEVATGEIVLTLDDDMVDLAAEDLQYLRRCFSDDEKLAALNFKVTWPGSDRIRDWVHRHPPSHGDSRFATYEITEGAVAWRLSALRAVGFFREDFFISHEGVELAIRLLDGGWSVVYDGQVAVGHAHAAGGRASWRRYYYDTRNQFAVAILHMPALYALKYVMLGTVSMGVYSLRDRHFLAWLRGVISGIGSLGRFRRERKVWTAHTAAVVAEADSWRPGFWTMAFRRLKQKDFSME